MERKPAMEVLQIGERGAVMVELPAPAGWTRVAVVPIGLPTAGAGQGKGR